MGGGGWGYSQKVSLQNKMMAADKTNKKDEPSLQLQTLSCTSYCDA